MKKEKIVFTNTCDGYYNAMDVHFTYTCDNDCDFCIDKMYDQKKYKINIYEMIDKVNQIKPDIMLILGGEPFIVPEKLFNFVFAIRHQVKELYITTTLPKVFLDNKLLVNAIIEGIDGLNISIQSIDASINNSILKAKDKHDRIKIMKKLIQRFSDKIRINLNLVKGFIDNKNELEKTLEILNSYGVKKVKINELQHTHKNYVSYEKIMGYKWPSAYAHGCQTFLKYKNIELLIKRACFLTEWSNKATWKDVLKLFIQLFKKKNKYHVLWGDGKLTNDWRRK